MKFSIIIPCYNEQDNINPIVKAFLPIKKKYEIELILVDNGSSDRTKYMIEENIKLYSWIKMACVTQNIGYGNGILLGLKKASGDCLGWIHADLQSNPAVFFRMIRSVKKEEKDFLYKGARTNRSLTDRVFTNGMAVFESAVFGHHLSDINSQPTLISRGFYNMWKNPPIDFSLDLYAYVLAKEKGVYVKRFLSPQRERLSGKSSWNVDWKSRFKMVKRVVEYSFETKRRIRVGNNE